MYTYHRGLVGVLSLLGMSMGSTACSDADSVRDTDTATVTGNGQNATEERQVGAFDAIAVSDSLTAMITVTADQPQRVQISGDSNLVTLVRATVSGTELILDMPPNTSFTTQLPLVVTVSAQSLHALAADRSAVAIANAVSGDDVTVESRNSAEVTIASLTAANLLTIASDASATLEATGITAGGSITLTADNAATATLSGTTPLLTAQVARSANLVAQDLNTASVVITTSTAATAQVCATRSLDATVTVGSAVGYHCNPANVVKSVDQSSVLSEQ